MCNRVSVKASSQTLNIVCMCVERLFREICHFKVLSWRCFSYSYIYIKAITVILRSKMDFVDDQSI